MPFISPNDANLDLSQYDIQRELASKTAMGGTHFSKAFSAIVELLKQVLPPLREKHNDNLAVVIAFMTDGEDSEGTEPGTVTKKWQTGLNYLQAFLRTSPLMKGVPSTFHSLAFGAGHDFPFLDNLRATAGTVEGGFQYAEPTDGAAAFKTKLDNIVNSASMPAVNTQLRLRIPGYLINTGSVVNENWVDGTLPSHTLHEAVLFPSRVDKIIFNAVLKKEFPSASTASSGASGVVITDLPSSPISAATSTSSSVTTDIPSSLTPSATNEWTTPVNTSTPITYATDYYGFSMPAFPQPGTHSSILYASDPYASTYDFGPQPGSSLADFGPQPGSSFGSQPGSSASIEPQAQDQAPTSAQSADSTPAEGHKATATISVPTPFTKTHASSNPNDAKDVEIGSEFIEVEAYQVRADRVTDGERISTLKIRVDRVYRSIDCAVLALEQMRIVLERMKTEIMQAILQKTAAGTKWSTYSAIIAKFEKQVNGSAESLISIGRSKRAAINTASEEVREMFTELHNLLATATKGDMSTTQLARMAEVAHGAQFSKARRGRAMDARATKNADIVEKEQKALAALQVDEDAVSEFVYSDKRDSDDTDKLLREWFCVLTQENWFNLLLDEKDCIGFGVALRRPEVVVDDPTTLRVLDISLTCVSKSAFEHVLTHKLIQASKDASDPIQAKLAYLGGFNVQGKDLGVVVRGTSNEPINAWLPLYINEHHWRVVSAQFNSMTGFLVTTNPLGYDFKQLTVYFMILAIMIVRMKIASHRQVELTIQYLRTCIAIATDKGYRARMKQAIADFVKNPECRLKDVLPNLLVLLGYLLALPKADLDELIPRKQDWTALWLALSAEIARRALDACSRTAQLGTEAATYFRNLISRLVDGYQMEHELTPEELDRVFSPEEKVAGGVSPLPKSERTFTNFSQAPGKPDPAEEEKKKQEDASKSLKELLEKRKTSSAVREAQAAAEATTKVDTDTKTKTKQRTGLWNDFWETAEAELESSEKVHHMEWASLRFTDDDRVKPGNSKTQGSSQDQQKTMNAMAGRTLVFNAASSATGRIPISRIAWVGMLYEHHYEGILEEDIEEETSDVNAASSSASSSATNDDTNTTKKSKLSAGAAAAKKDASIRTRESLVDTAEIKNRPFLVDACLPKMVEAIELCENVIANFGQPTLEGLINIMTFMRSWYTLQELCGGHEAALKQLDGNLGVAPVSWMVHFRDDWERRPHVRNSFFTFLNFIDLDSMPSFHEQTEKELRSMRPQSADSEGGRRDTFSFASQMLQLQMLRAMLAQSAKYATNRDAREAIEMRHWKEPSTDAATMLKEYHNQRVQRLIAAASASAATAASKARITRVLATDDIFEYIALLREMCVHRYCREMAELMDAFTAVTAPARPLAPLKLAIFLSGRFVDPGLGITTIVLPGGEVIPGKSKYLALQKTWGPAWKSVQQMIILGYVRYK